jgi:DNA polymerase III delta prime subunit
MGEMVLRAFVSISQHARRKLSGVDRSGDPSWLQEEARRNLGRILLDDRQALQTLQREPSIARVEVKWLDTNEEEVLYICRASSAGILPDGLEGRLVSYRAALGRLAAIPAGQEVEIALPRTERPALVRVRALLHPSFLADEWDSYDNSFELTDFRVAIESIRRLLGYEKQGAAAEIVPDFLAEMFAEDEVRQLYLAQRRRKTLDRMELRDQHILDQYQDSIFRLPLDKQLLLLGPPGTGKTTTLIKRLAQKRTEEALTLDESEKLEGLGIKADFLSDTGWVMFSPTELLKLYVQEAFNREGTPASRQNLSTWDAERISIGRDTFRILRGATSGRFILADTEETLMDCSSPALAGLHDEVASEVDSQIIARCSRAREWMRESGDAAVRDTLAKVEARFGIGPVTLNMVHEFGNDDRVLRSSLDLLSRQIDEQQRAFANQMLMPDPGPRLNELVKVLLRNSATDSSTEDEEDDDDDGEPLGDELPVSIEGIAGEATAAKLLIRVVRWLAVDAVQAHRRLASGGIGTVLKWLGDRRPPATDMADLGHKVQLQRRLRILSGAPRSLVFAVPPIYSRFRTRCAGAGRWFRNMVPRYNRISPAEADILILVMLRNSRRALRMLGETNWLKPIADRYVMQVLVDEATDFSAVQLACMLELANPKLRAWFACGDFRQRITRHGIRTVEELHWIAAKADVKEIETRQVQVDYRQSPRLKLLADALDTGHLTPGSFSPSTDGDPLPLLAEHLTGEELAAWLAERILEVERSVGSLPSIGIFVDGEDRIDPLVASIRPRLTERSLKIVGCRDGRDVGNVQEVRVFDIQHVKGLEFEAVFFVAADSLAGRLPDLFDRYIYVGVTRAATFLGITCEGGLPNNLEYIRPVLSSSTWQ